MLLCDCNNHMMGIQNLLLIIIVAPKSTDASYVKNLIAENRIAEMIAAAGMVRTHATTMFRVTLQRTAENRLADPTPEIAPVITCVVDTGTPR